MLRLAGFIALLGSALLIWRGYRSYIMSREAAVRAFYSALCDFSEKLGCYLDTPRVWSASYSDPLLEECGFLDSLRRGDCIIDAYTAAKASLSIDGDADEVLTVLFSRFGDGYLEDELSALRRASDRLGRISEQMREESERRIRVAGAFIGAVCACTVIMLV